MASRSDIRIAKNTLIIYIRMAVTIVVGLISSRLVLQALGASDVGIYSAVGSAVMLVSAITTAMTATTVRFMNIELGKSGGNPGRMFNICHTIHIGGALLLLLILETIGLWYIHNKLNVPPGKEADAMFVFQVSTLVACLSIANVPFQGLFTVHERFGTIAIVDILNAFIKLGLVVCLLLFVRENGLRIYALMMSVMTLVSFVVYHLLCRRKWPEMVRWSFVREWKDYRDVLHFNNWNLLHSSAVISRSQGSNMLINAFFGTTVNAAFYYAATLQNYVSQFISNFDTASAPQIAQSVGSGEIPQATALARRTGRICLLLFLLLFFPLWCEMDFIVGLWLGKIVPAETFLMCRWTLVVAAVSATSAGLVQLINALGRIKWYKIEVSVLFFGCLLAGWLLFRAGFPAYTIIVSFVVADLLNRLIQFILLHFQFRFDVRGYFKEAYLRPLMVFVIMGAYLLIYPHFGFDGIWLRLLGVFITLILSMLAVLFVGLTSSERSSLKRFVFRRA